jgi:hypothetical protein
MFIISIIQNIFILIKKLILIQQIQLNIKKSIKLNILKKNILFLFIYFFINFYFFPNTAFCDTEMPKKALSDEELKLEEDKKNIYLIEQIVTICILSTIIIGAMYFLTDGFDFPGNSSGYQISEEKLEYIKKVEEAQKIWAERPKNIIYARICPQIIYNCDIPPGAWRDHGVYDYLD